MNDHIPANVFLHCAGLSFLIVSVIMWFMLVMVSNDRQRDRVTENTWRNYRHELFLAATGDTTVSAHKQAIAQYLGENIAEFDEIVAREKLITSTMNEGARTALHIQDSKKVPRVLLSLSKDEWWQRLRNDKESLGILKKILQKEVSVPTLELVDASFRLLWWWPLGILIPQFCAFCAYLIRWNDVSTEWSGSTRVMREGFGLSERYCWYHLWWPVLLSMVLLLPGALPIMGVAIVVSILRKVPTKFSAYRDRRRTDALIAHGGGEQLYTLLAEKLRKGGDSV